MTPPTIQSGDHDNAAAADTPRAAALGRSRLRPALLDQSRAAAVRDARGPVCRASWTEDAGGRVRLALSLMPFAGIAFLWFIGVDPRPARRAGGPLLRVGLPGQRPALPGDGVRVDVSGGCPARRYQRAEDHAYSGDTVAFGRATMLQIGNVYALRMAAVFMISLGTIWLRTGAHAPLVGRRDLRAGCCAPLRHQPQPVGGTRLPRVGAHRQPADPRAKRRR